MIRAFFLHTTLLFLPIFSTQAYAQTPDAACTKAGGTTQSGVCMCEGNVPLINPWVGHCIKNLTVQVARVPQTGSGNCPPGSPKPEPVSRAALCENPAKYVCEDQYNPATLTAKASQRKFFAIKETAATSPSVMAFIHSKNEAAYNCAGLERADQNECNTQIEAVLNTTLYTEARKEKASEIYREAQNALVKILEKRKSALAQTSTPELDMLNSMIEKIKTTPLKFGPYRKGDHSEYNAEHETDGVHIEGLITEVDASPENLTQTLLHELGHLVGPVGKFRIDGVYTGSPFKKELQCLKDDRSIGAKTADIPCFEKLAQKYKNGGERTQAYVTELLRAVKLNPDTGYLNAFYDPSDQCQMGQLDEAFADWIDTEAFSELHQADLQAVANATLDQGALVNLQARLESDPSLSAFLGENCVAYKSGRNSARNRAENKDSHPLEEDRFNAIFLAHPLLKAAIGCTSDTGNQNAKLYCGQK